MGKGVKAQLADLNAEVGRLHDRALTLFEIAAQMGNRGEPETKIQATVREANVLVERSKHLSEQIQVLQSKQYIQVNFQLMALTLVLAGFLIVMVLTV